MRFIVQNYLTRELFKTFIPAFIGFVFLILLGLTIQLLHSGLGITDVRVIIPYLMLHACPDALPVSLLASIVMVYGKMSSDNEIVALRTSGMHLQVIITPVIIISFLLSFVTLYLNAEALPNANRKIKMLKEIAVSSVLSRHISSVKKKIVFDPYHIYIGEIEGNTYKNLAIIEYVKDFVTNILLAEEGMIMMASDGNSVILSLKKGDFAKMNYLKPTEVPRVGTFDEMSFEIPINKKKVPTSNKYKTLFQLYDDKKEIDLALEQNIALLNPGNDKDFFQLTNKKLKTYKLQHEELIEKQDKLEEEMAKLRNSINKSKKRQDNIKSETHTIENQIAVSNIKIDKTKREAGETGSQPEIDELNRKIKIHLNELQSRKKEYAEKLDSIRKDDEELVIITGQSLELKESITELEKSGEKLLNFKKIEKLLGDSRSTSKLIHKRLSSSFLCITFALIGIPLGLLSKSGNILINFGISFMVVILIHYPLSVVGVILSEETFPVIPSIWGANAILLITGLILFRKSLSK